MIHVNSRNLLTSVVSIVDPVSGKLVKPEFLDLRQRVTATAPDDRFITHDASKQWAHHGLEQLGDARHYWVICDLSGVIDPFVELTPGRQLRAPSIDRFLFGILAPDQQQT